MSKIIACVADHSDIAKTCLDALQLILIMGFCLGISPALIWLAKMSYGIRYRYNTGGR